MVDPILISFFGINIYWYGLVYLLGFLFGYLFLKNNVKKINLSKKQFEDFFFYILIFSIIGARLFYVLFYNFSYYFSNPFKVLAVWEGGMSIHGGLFFGFLTIYYFSKKYNFNLLKALDIIVIPTILAQSFGRLANFINQELVGKITLVPWGVIFEKVDNNLRHPSVLYESISNMLLFQILLFLYYFYYHKLRPGTLLVIYIIGYFLIRFFIDFFREPTLSLGFISLGQLFSIIFIFVFIFVYYKFKN